ncbi:beta-glucosidase family protein [Lachnoclostridium phytofermentans]|uniref:beta-glucosidase family protein n=1 Tax=Lachnoclostridium phytofermentans TaxID=66219 RepID=UPI00049527EE|nr:glycoside hydrolase family 3 C-terminal domain-containing protein [Lachnoclostridium phytofermentans]
MKKVNETIIENLLSQMTLEEKIGLIHGNGIFRSGGVERLGIPSLKMSDGPMGVRREIKDQRWFLACNTDDYVSYLPSNSAIAATWNKDLAYTSGQVLGSEARGRGKDIILAPGINIKRSPLCGRNFEYMSEDPKLIEELASSMIKGIQDNDVAACVKHFAVNNQETDRLAVDTDLEDRALYEIYLPGFKAAVKNGGSYSIMGAYNKFRGEQCCENSELLGTILREEWGYDGAIISDWGGVHDTKAAANSPLDIEMDVKTNFDNYYMAKPLLEAVHKGEISEDQVDKKVRNILRLMLRLKMIGEESKQRKSGTYNTISHQQELLKVARESIILLKNEEDRLPLKKEITKLAVIGRNADTLHAAGGGSAEIKALYEISPLLGIRMELGGNTEVTYHPGYYVPFQKVFDVIGWQETSTDVKAERAKREEIWHVLEQESQDKREAEEKRLREEAVLLAKETEEVILIVGLDHHHDVEGNDRVSYELPYAQEKLIEEVLKVNPNTILVVYAGSPVSMQKFSGKAKAIVWSYYNGMQGGKALAEVLFGMVNPSGKLPESMPKELNDCPAHKYGEFGREGSVYYNEGIMVGYRYYDTEDITPEFCFGHGLSYTSFSYHDLEARVNKEKGVFLSFSIRNTGNVAGAEIIQVYVSDPVCSVKRPIHELKGFTKVFLQPGEEKELMMELKPSAFTYYCTKSKKFVLEAGEFIIEVGSSSRDIRMSQTVKID